MLVISNILLIVLAIGFLGMHLLYFLMEDVDKIRMGEDFSMIRLLLIGSSALQIALFASAIKSRKINSLAMAFTLVGILFLLIGEEAYFRLYYYIAIAVFLILFICLIVFEKLKLKVLLKFLYGIIALLYLAVAGCIIYFNFFATSLTFSEFKELILVFLPFMIIVFISVLLSFASFFLIFKKDND